jgi:hypothetical protein
MVEIKLVDRMTEIFWAMPKTFPITNRIIFFLMVRDKIQTPTMAIESLATRNFQLPISMIRKLGNQKIAVAKKMVNVHLNRQK